MATSIPKKPTLNKLKGNLVLSDEKRKKYNIKEGLLIDETKHWSNGKKVIESYFKEAGDDWIESADDFVKTLLDSLNKLADQRNKYKDQDGLLQKYCLALKIFYQNEQIKNKLKNIYSCNALTKKIKNNERKLYKQSTSTMLVLTRERAQLLEEEVEERMSSKRRVENEGESSCSNQRKKHTDEEQSESEGKGEQKSREEEDESVQVEEMYDSQDSFDSLERHPKCQSYYNYFVADCKERFSITDNNSWISSNGTNISKAMFQYRCESYRAAKLLYSISPERILALSFIFVFNLNDIQGFISKCKSEKYFIQNELELFKQRKIPNDALIIANSLDNLRRRTNDRNLYMARTHSLYWDENLEMTAYYNIINSFHQHVNILHDYHTEQDYDYYEFFTKEVFKSDLYVKHKMSKHLTGSVDYIPDYKLAFEYQHRKFTDLFIIEVKKDKREYTPDTDDTVKINLELQIMLNELILLNIAEPVVYGMVLRGNLILLKWIWNTVITKSFVAFNFILMDVEHNCTLFEMTLKQEGQYISHVVDSFNFPRNKNDITLIPRVVSIFLSLRDMIDDTVSKIQNRKKGKSKLVSYMKEGMSLPCPIKKPLRFYEEHNEDNCNPPM